MWNFRRIAIFAAIGIALVGLFFAIRATRSSEPRYQGRALSSWLGDLSSGDTNIVAQARIAIRSMGTNATPFLMKILTYQESSTHRKLRQSTEKWPNQLRFFELNYVRNVEAANGINALGVLAEPEFPTLTNLFYNGRIISSGIALAGVGQKGVRVLVDALTNQTLNARFCNSSALALGHAQSDFDMVVPALIRVLRTGNSSERSTAAESLGRLRQKPELAIPALIEQMNDSDPAVRDSVNSALREVSPESLDGKKL